MVVLVGAVVVAAVLFARAAPPPAWVRAVLYAALAVVVVGQAASMGEARASRACDSDMYECDLTFLDGIVWGAVALGLTVAWAIALEVVNARRRTRTAMPGIG